MCVLRTFKTLCAIFYKEGFKVRQQSIMLLGQANWVIICIHRKWLIRIIQPQQASTVTNMATTLSTVTRFQALNDCTRLELSYAWYRSFGFKACSFDKLLSADIIFLTIGVYAVWSAQSLHRVSHRPLTACANWTLALGPQTHERDRFKFTFNI